MMRESTRPARRLRSNQTDAERVLWFRLRDRRLAGLKFKRQVPIERFIVDFFCADAKLIVELDGGQHDQNKESDGNRTRILEAMGYLVVRFWNNDVMRNTDGVLEEILSTINQHRSEPPHPTPLPTQVGLAGLARLVRNPGKPGFRGEREHI
jgi:very-short-patch-repair endonuclease